MSFVPIDRLRSGAQELGIELGDDQLTRLDRFAEFLVEANKLFNLTRITQPDEIVTSHYLDSLTCLAAFEPSDGAKVIDVGSGPGFPGMPIKIARPDLSVVLLEATRKKADFISEAIRLLDLSDASALNDRAEEIGRDKAHREKYDIAYARALSEMKVVAELCLPLVKVGGVVVAQKSSDIDEELASARPIIGQIGGQIREIKQITIPDTTIIRQLVIITKTAPTSANFPRSYSRITASRGRK